MNQTLTQDDFFDAYPDSRRLFDAVLDTVQSLSPVDLRVTKSQVAFWRKKAFAWAWIPEQYLHRKGAPLVLTQGFRQHDPSPRWKSVVEPYPGRFTHHLELFSKSDIDDEGREWLRAPWELAG
jgi:hypothetical protein